jgi:hypothetical protein
MKSPNGPSLKLQFWMLAKKLILYVFGAVLIWVVLLFAAFSLVFSPIPFTPCGWGFGQTHHDKQAVMLRREFKEQLPPDLELQSFHCYDGFGDRSVEAEFMLQVGDGNRLLEALDNTLHESEDPERRIFRKTRKAFSTPTEQVVTFELPGFGILHWRTVTLRWDHKGTQPWRIKFSGFEM